MFTSSARERRFINCQDLTEEPKTFFVDLRETHQELHLLLLYSRGWSQGPFNVGIQLCEVHDLVIATGFKYKNPKITLCVGHFG